MSCSDCKDGFYYPLVGPREKCQTCSSKPMSEADIQRLIEKKRSVIELADKLLRDKKFAKRFNAQAANI